MPIEFKCPSCAAMIRVPEIHAGRKGHCPSCREMVRIPATGASNSSAIDKVKGSSGVNASGFITFDCPSCTKRTGFPTALAGTAAPCPICQAQIMVPAESGGTSFVVGSSELPMATEEVETSAKKSPLLYAVAGLGVAGVLFGIAFVWGRGSQTPPVAAAPTPPIVASTPPTPSPVTSVSPVAAMAPGDPVRPGVIASTPPPLPPDGRETPIAVAPSAKLASAEDEQKAPVPENVSSLLAAQEKKTTSRDAASAGEKTDDDAANSYFQKKQSAGAAPTPPPAPTSVAAAKNAHDDALDDVPEPAKKQEAPSDKRAAMDPKPAERAPAPVAAAAAKPPAPLPICAQCLGTGYLPIVPSHIFIHGATEAVTPAITANAVPWRLCTKCGVGKDPQALVATEAARLAAAPAIHKKWETLAGVKLSYVETHHITLRATFSETELKIVANALEQLSTQLEQSTQSTVLTQIRPDTDEMVIGSDNAGYLAILDALKALDPKGDWSLAKDSSGFLLPHLAISNAQRGGGTGARDMALYQFGEMVMTRASDGKAPTWLRLGFAAYCENLITKKNLVYAFQYEKNEVHFGDNWDNEIKKFAAQSKLKTWDQMFLMQPIGATALDYLTCYSMVNFFMSNDPKLFPKLVLAFKEGLDSEHAIKKVYNTDFTRIQMMWANWAIAK